jgi:hypothetical protein
MTSFQIYAVAGVLLSALLFFIDDGELSINAILFALLFGWLVGVPAFVLALVLFGNWPYIIRCAGGRSHMALQGYSLARHSLYQHHRE